MTQKNDFLSWSHEKWNMKGVCRRLAVKSMFKTLGLAEAALEGPEMEESRCREMDQTRDELLAELTKEGLPHGRKMDIYDLQADTALAYEAQGYAKGFAAAAALIRPHLDDLAELNRFMAQAF